MLKGYTELLHLTHPQKRIWYLENIYPGTPMFNIGGPVIIHGTVNFNILKRAIHFFLYHNEGSRLRIVVKDNEAYQYISEFKEIKPNWIDFSILEQPNEAYQQWVENEAQKPFYMFDNDLFEFTFFKLSDEKHGYLPKFHHIIADGWTMQLLTKTISHCYESLLDGKEPAFNQVYSYKDYILKESLYLESERFIKDKKFWNVLFKDLSHVSLGKNSNSIKGRRKTYQLDATLSNRIREFANVQKVSLNTFFVFSYLLFRYKMTGITDIVIGTPVLNRSGKREKNTIGMFSNAMPCRFILNENSTVIDSLAKVNEDLGKFYFHQKYPYELLAKDLELKKNGIENLYNFCVNYYNTRLSTRIGGALLENTEFYNGHQIYSMQLVVKDWSEEEELLLDYDYKIDEYTEHDIDFMYKSLLILIDKMINESTELLSNLSLLTTEEEDLFIFQYNETRKEYSKSKTVIDLFMEQVARTPDRIAIRHGSRAMSYQELHNKSNLLADYLVQKGVLLEDIVGIYMHHSIEMIVALLAVLKSGAAYMPIDPTCPEDTLSYMIKEAKCNILLSSLNVKIESKLRCEIIEMNQFDWQQVMPKTRQAIYKSNNLAYVIFTSGSTGKPKGVLIEHKSLVNYIEWASNTYVTDEDEIFAFYSSLSFDLTVTSIFTPLICGLQIEVYGQEDQDDEYVLLRIIKDTRVTIIKLTPSHLSLISNMKFDHCSVRTLIVGGENLTTELARRTYENFNQKVDIYNEYGPTEATVGCMIHKYSAENDKGTSVPIGQPAANTQVYVLDKKLRPVPMGVIGEIYISGVGVARGYLNQPHLTYEKFIDHPLLEGQKLYVTKDLAKFIDQNTLVYLGRVDNQVKINGQRIELDELETRLKKHELIKEALVVSVKKEHSDKIYLCAYIVWKDGNKTADSYDIRKLLTHSLSDKLVPLQIVNLPCIPLTRNGKVDYAHLPIPEVDIHRTKRIQRNLTKNEETLIQVLRQILNKNISIEDDYFQMGADSIHAILISSKLRDLGYSLTVQDIMNHSIIADMALCMSKKSRGFIDQDQLDGDIKHTPITLWFFAQNLYNVNHYNQSIVLNLKQDITVIQMEQVLSVMIKHHDTLRLNYCAKTNTLYYNSGHLTRKIRIESFDLSNVPPEQQEGRYSQLSYELKSSFDIESGLLIKACYFILSDNNRKVLITAHHLVIDAVSWRIFIQDLELLLHQLSNKLDLILPEKTHSYRKWANKLNIYAQNIPTRNVLFWRNTQYTDEPRSLSSRSIKYNERSHQIVALDKEKTSLLLGTANFSYNTHTEELLMIALAYTLTEVSDTSNVWLEIESHGRDYFQDEINLTNTIGWFTVLYPIRLTVPNQKLDKLIMNLKEQIRTVPSNGLDYGVMKYLLEDERLKNCNVVKIRFNYLGDFSKDLENEFFATEISISEDDISQQNVGIYDTPVINCYVHKNQLYLMISNRSADFEGVKIDTFLMNYKQNINSIVEHCSITQKRHFTPSDFDTVDLTQEDLDRLFSIS
ncbi:amino acid adenylation domain-containing protein [Paenibacillus sp. LMG 31461]|uniref:Amino acid adenylation domain-containing protein n=1 Tax=Paenibacillus plantarum TaxID=2654975 RepID=A0ABX1X8U0_9BACL|nr:non-ribosomal peptide synthetase [Paenibacillus plantarum]NOU64742.1 amino acid adenylation domain-containing protein [Paenibacillus plantarum]